MDKKREEGGCFGEDGDGETVTSVFMKDTNACIGHSDFL